MLQRVSKLRREGNHESALADANRCLDVDPVHISVKISHTELSTGIREGLLEEGQSSLRLGPIE